MYTQSGDISLRGNGCRKKEGIRMERGTVMRRHPPDISELAPLNKDLGGGSKYVLFSPRSLGK